MFPHPAQPPMPGRCAVTAAPANGARCQQRCRWEIPSDIGALGLGSGERQCHEGVFSRGGRFRAPLGARHRPPHDEDSHSRHRTSSNSEPGAPISKQISARREPTVTKRWRGSPRRRKRRRWQQDVLKRTTWQETLSLSLSPRLRRPTKAARAPRVVGNPLPMSSPKLNPLGTCFSACAWHPCARAMLVFFAASQLSRVNSFPAPALPWNLLRGTASRAGQKLDQRASACPSAAAEKEGASNYESFRMSLVPGFWPPLGNPEPSELPAQRNPSSTTTK